MYGADLIAVIPLAVVPLVLAPVVPLVLGPVIPLSPAVEADGSLIMQLTFPLFWEVLPQKSQRRS